ncbi:hypothetical protein MDOR_33200 [Mycolicibacterium doricum]|uniref:Uncharacterized protein n=1 Tax=Mycolicibacterium doricum TaxID=126673 RepID=A0A1X1TIQ0_9MYCO|nr:hypothetical protein AWC01_03635 [Mycolicibacterium doricum]BBZ09151.1 hypothetical protein MDOR_33200 [Mycolicibacterium doricum]
MYKQGRAAAGAWLDTHLTGAGNVLDIERVQLFLTELVPRTARPAITACAAAGGPGRFPARSFDLKLPPWQLMVTGQLTGPGLDARRWLERAGPAVDPGRCRPPDDRYRDRAQPP